MQTRLLHTPEGVRDIYGKEYSQKLSIERRIHDKLMRYGYRDIDTPTFEFIDVFSRDIGTTPSKELYKFFDKEGNTLTLRPDFTPAIARCAAKYYMDETVPVRFCYRGNTFSNTSNLQGKLKEVTQMGAELIDDGSVEADAEMLSLVIECLKSVGLKQFQISVGQVDYFKGICNDAGIDTETEMLLKEYISNKNLFGVEGVLSEKGIDPKYNRVFLRIADLFGHIDCLKEARELAQNDRSLKAIKNLENMYKVLKLYGVENYISFDLGMLSRYNYYTGIIFKAYTYGVGDAVMKGGRYDNLLEKFGKCAPAIGFAAVIDDLMEALNRQNISIPVNQEPKQIFYSSDNYEAKLKEAITLRSQGVCVELLHEKQSV